MKTKHISRRFRRFAKANEAVSALEYAILVGVIAVAISAALLAFSGNITAALTAIGTEVGATDPGDIDLE
jgi:Flp pilus assembly pilin Flp